MVPFLETLNYSSSNEDGRSEIKALGIKGQDSVLCITGSGARPLDLLTQVPKEIVSVDFNPCQNFLLELKMESIRCLDYEEFLQFIGVRPCRTRGYLYKGIQQSLSTGAKSFWDSHPEMIQKGVLYAGRWERYFRRLALFISLVRPRLLSRLFGSDGVREQSRIWHERWNNVSWRVFLRLVSSRMFWRHAFGDPGFFLYVQRGFSIYRYLNERFASAVENMLLRESPFAMLLFFGKYDEHGSFPVHLQKQHYETLKEGVDRVRIVTGSLIDYLAHCRRKSLDRYSLSDFASYTDTYLYEKTWEEIIRTAAEGARVCERQFLVKRGLPPEVMSSVIRDTAMEEELAETDNSIFYTFLVGKIRGDG